tara:strand:- start:789 stop:1199 length:411 start_codon:yes stop_codon:yes gene_type:complete
MEKITIGRLAKSCDVKTDTIRYYERVNLVSPEGRTNSGYRFYDPESIRRVKFIKNAQRLGFSLYEIRKLLELRVSNLAMADDVLKIAQSKINEFQNKISELDKIKKVLEGLAEQCPGNVHVMECPILDYLYPSNKN